MESYLILENNKFISPQLYIPADEDDDDNVNIFEADDIGNSSLLDPNGIPIDPETGKPLEIPQDIPDNIEIPGQTKDDIPEESDEFVDNPEDLDKEVSDIQPSEIQGQGQELNSQDPIEFISLKKLDLLNRLFQFKNELEKKNFFSDDLDIILRFGKILKYNTLLILSKKLVEQIKINNENIEKK
ncbi:MAG: hypothetical protein LBV58_01145 [Acholeplasmatales bacterium]|jgi:hypothetical protein|nr:hypothetical protein [Acholeplasmatales bacterium]